MKDSLVYIVDDDPVVLESVRNSLHSVGMLVHTYHSAEQFIPDFCPNNAACLIVDLQMPGMTGMELIEWLRARRIEMPVIVLSGHGNIPAVVESMKLGAAEFLEKPVDDRVLITRVRELRRYRRFEIASQHSPVGKKSSLNCWPADCPASRSPPGWASPSKPSRTIDRTCSPRPVPLMSPVSCE